jgi:hypothetical protein
MKRVSVKTGKTSIISGSGNVFTDLQLSNAEGALGCNHQSDHCKRKSFPNCGFRGTENKSAEDIRSGELPLGWIFCGTPDEFS